MALYHCHSRSCKTVNEYSAPRAVLKIFLIHFLLSKQIQLLIHPKRKGYEIQQSDRKIKMSVSFHLNQKFYSDHLLSFPANWLFNWKTLTAEKKKKKKVYLFIQLRWDVVLCCWFIFKQEDVNTKSCKSHCFNFSWITVATFLVASHIPYRQCK